MDGASGYADRRLSREGFTLIELLVVVAIIAVLAALLLPALSRSKGSVQRIACANNLRQVRLALALYVHESGGRMPPQGVSENWPAQLKAEYVELKLLRCPSDGPANNGPALTNSLPDAAARSFLMNGFQDFYLLEGTVPPKGQPFPPVSENSIEQPTASILFGEKQSSSLQYYLVLNADASQYLEDLEESRHGGTAGASNKAGSANYAFADGSVRALRYATSLCPLNLWAITAAGRTNYAVCRPH